MVQGVKKEEFEKNWLGEIVGVARQPPNFSENCVQVPEVKNFDQHLREMAGATRQRLNFRGNSSQVWRDGGCSAPGPVQDGFF
ncbi:hypothetical protein HAX54_004883 [Datura stramonium]|uniref:Uncharacterized protein n=1 Tax=Datura stramonium TaxID=4076 RepID=A0ABS8RU65_DATST|nr:hypothetical protein [Datura stramonium]